MRVPALLARYGALTMRYGAPRGAGDALRYAIGGGGALRCAGDALWCAIGGGSAYGTLSAAVAVRTVLGGSGDALAMRYRRLLEPCG
jgi:hypothetical protein